MIRSVKERVRKQPYSGNSAKERSIDRFQPILVRAFFDEVLKHLVTSLNQISANADVVPLTGIDLPYRRVCYITLHAEQLAE